MGSYWKSTLRKEFLRRLIFVRVVRQYASCEPLFYGEDGCGYIASKGSALLLRDESYWLKMSMRGVLDFPNEVFLSLYRVWGIKMRLNSILGECSKHVGVELSGMGEENLEGRFIGFWKSNQIGEFLYKGEVQCLPKLYTRSFWICSICPFMYM